MKKLETSEVIIPNKEALEVKINKFKEGGADNLHVLTDFDRTLTKAFVEGQKSPTVIAQIRNGNYLSPEYVEKAHELFDEYHPIEIDPKIGREEKNEKMYEWWKKHFDVLIECGISENILRDVVRSQKIQFRDGVLEELDTLAEKKVPVVIMSAGPGDMIRLYLEEEGRLTDNIHIVANMFEFDDNKNVVGVQEPIIHSLNKYETVIHDFPAFDSIEERKNVLLMGDSIDDFGMIDGFDADNVLSIGFLNEDPEGRKDEYSKKYDIVLTGDQDFSEVRRITKKII